MTALESYKKEIREMFFISVDNEIDMWTNKDVKDLYSPVYDKDKCINLDMRKNKLFFVQNLYNNKQHSIFICRYKFWFIPLDLKVYKYFKKLRQHFNEKMEDEKNKKDIFILNSGLEKIKEKHFLAIRKEKLDQIENK
jgi:hypothetical protein